MVLDDVREGLLERRNLRNLLCRHFRLFSALSSYYEHHLECLLNHHYWIRDHLRDDSHVTFWLGARSLRISGSCYPDRVFSRLCRPPGGPLHPQCLRK